MCCINIRNFVDQFYQFVEGVPHRRSGIDEVLRRVSPAFQLRGITESLKTRYTTVVGRSAHFPCLEEYLRQGQHDEEPQSSCTSRH